MKLFFCSQKNHIKIFSKLIRDYNFQNAQVILLYTNSTLNTLYEMRALVRSSIFDACIELKLPLHPLHFNLGTIYLLKKTYVNLLDSNHIHSIYLVSYEQHYSLLCKIATEKGIQTNLVEEGTATYKYLVKDYNNENQKKKLVLSELIEFIYLSLWKPIFRCEYTTNFLYNIISKILLSFKAVLLSIPYIFMYDFFQRIFYKLIPFLKTESLAFIKGNFQFNNTYTTFPKLSRKVFLASSYRKFFPHNIDTDFNTDNITKGSYLFISQPYKINKEVYYQSIIAILERIACDNGVNIYIKLHPRESSELQAYIQGCILKLQNNHLYLLDAEHQTSVETMLASDVFTKLLGITSTALVYSPSINPNIEVLSIVDELLLSLSKHTIHDKIELNNIYKHKNILKIFNHISYCKY